MMIPETPEKSKGWIRMYRRVLEKGWLANPKLWAFWSWCLLKASHRARTVIVDHQTINLQPGQFLFGRKRAAAELCQSEQSIRTHLAFLKNIERSITIQATNRFSIITVVNWTCYQGEKHAYDHPQDQQLTNKSPTSHHKQEWSNNGKQERGLSPASNDQLAQFEKFYAAYPRHEGKRAALEAFLEVNLSDPERVTAILEHQKVVKKQLKENGQFASEWPMPARWLLEKRWEDEIQRSDSQITDPIQRAMKKMGIVSRLDGGLA
ncbi:MAG: hypothetical protein A4E65_00064 [Syntrophorhabdus sp. PtaU1.Bin153]|jgi:hypothetical protein|nr:MAG: hypothetical protein A4E65_00064 [Syntrophorhabdus sp. PtaU1.Bin153]